MEFVLSYIRRNIKIAFKSVIFHYKQYICFFAAIFVVQMFFGIITMSSDNANDLEYALVNEEYNYHIVLKDLNSAQYVTMINDEYSVFRNEQVHEVVRVKERDEPGTYDSKYDIYIYLNDEPSESLASLKERYFYELASLNPDGLRYAYSPLYHFDDNLRANTAYYVLFAALITAVSVYLLMSLYDIRLNHYKFTYGIYMTFGADYRKLAETSFWEMMTVASLTYIPAALISYLTNFIIYRVNGQFFNFYPSSSLTKMFVFSFVIAAVSVLLPMLRLSRRTPLSLIISEDNSNLVVSPRVSTDITGLKLPGRYERLTLWRFRKYLLKLVATAGIFCIMFMCGLFYTHMYATEQGYDIAQFTLTFNKGNTHDYTYTDEMRAEIDAIDGITGTFSATEFVSPHHILLEDGQVKLGTPTVDHPAKENTKATNFVECYEIHAGDLEYFERFDYSGDLSALLESDHNIIISDSFDNASNFRFKPGDTIRICVSSNNYAKAPDNLTGDNLLRWQLERLDYNYEEFTVAAVLHNYPSFENIPIFFNEKYAAETEFRTVDIFVDRTLDTLEVEEIHEELREWAEPYGNITVKTTHAASLRLIEAAKNKISVYTCVSSLILVITPLIWFFSQTLFYSKRENEYVIIEAFGALRSEVKKLHIFDGIFASIAGGLFCVLIDLVGVYVIYKFVNVILPYFVMYYRQFRYSFYLPPIPFIISIIVSAGCGFLSVWIPWRIYHKKMENKVSSAEFGDE